MHHAGAQTRQMRRPARSQLIRMHDPMSEDIVPTRTTRTSAIFDRKF